MFSGWSIDVASWTSLTTTCLYASVNLARERTSRSENSLVEWLKLDRKPGRQKANWSVSPSST
ncbi:hypothetical protein T4C_12916 [Trichinella pseudospiralis]|uniref:Uncharacterized protein n=1 Tax=Trichinella pseudospiralis TaxID=6337 RepID=A0A0V1JVN2_TRIPS|nr:hypothetical protein T4C_12916 [Trichinella pseudospiralis]